MSEKKTIRIIKKGGEIRVTAKPNVDSAREVAREMVGTVTNWVSEFQEKRRNENTNALRMLSERSLSENLGTRPGEGFDNRAALEREMHM